MVWNRIEVGSTQNILFVSFIVRRGYTSLYTVDASKINGSNTYKLTIKNVTSNDFNYAYMCFDDSLDESQPSRVYYFAQITNGSSNSRNSYYILHITRSYL